MWSILNESSTRVLKIRRVGFSPTGTAASPAGFLKMAANTYAATATLGTPTAYTPLALDTANSALSSATEGYGGTVGGTPLALRQWLWDVDDFGATRNDFIEWSSVLPWAIVLDAGWGDTSVQPITLREDEMFSLDIVVTASAGNLSGWCEFTDEAL